MTLPPVPQLLVRRSTSHRRQRPTQLVENCGSAQFGWWMNSDHERTPASAEVHCVHATDRTDINTVTSSQPDLLKSTKNTLEISRNIWCQLFLPLTPFYLAFTAIKNMVTYLYDTQTKKPAPVHSHSWVSLTYHSKNKIKLSNCSKLMNCLTTKAKFLLKYNRPNTEQAYMHQSSLGQFRRDEWHKSLHQRMNSHGWWSQNSRVGSDNTRPWRWVTAHSSAVNGQRRHCHIDNVT